MIIINFSFHFKIYNNLILEEKENNLKIKEDEIKNITILRFESEFKSGKINGKRKIYNNKGNLIFEGDYLNGVKHGKGKEYHYIDIGFIGFAIPIKFDYIQFIYEGDYSRGKKNGKGKEYLLFSYLIYEDKNLSEIILQKYERRNNNFNRNYIYDEENKNKIKNKKMFNENEKVYNYFELLLYKGEYKNGKWEGKGK